MGPVCNISEFDVFEFCKGKGVGYFAHPEDCSKFVSCVESHAYVQPCPDGMRYDATTGLCNRAYRVPCNSSHSEDSFDYRPTIGSTRKTDSSGEFEPSHYKPTSHENKHTNDPTVFKRIDLSKSASQNPNNDPWKLLSSTTPKYIEDKRSGNDGTTLEATRWQPSLNVLSNSPHDVTNDMNYHKADSTGQHKAHQTSPGEANKDYQQSKTNIAYSSSQENKKANPTSYRLLSGEPVSESNKHKQQALHSQEEYKTFINNQPSSGERLQKQGHGQDHDTSKEVENEFEIYDRNPRHYTPLQKTEEYDVENSNENRSKKQQQQQQQHHTENKPSVTSEGYDRLTSREYANKENKEHYTIDNKSSEPYSQRDKQNDLYTDNKHDQNKADSRNLHENRQSNEHFDKRNKPYASEKKTVTHDSKYKNSDEKQFTKQYTEWPNSAEEYSRKTKSDEARSSHARPSARGNNEYDSLPVNHFDTYRSHTASSRKRNDYPSSTEYYQKPSINRQPDVYKLSSNHRKPTYQSSLISSEYHVPTNSRSSRNFNPKRDYESKNETGVRNKYGDNTKDVVHDDVPTPSPYVSQTHN